MVIFLLSLQDNNGYIEDTELMTLKRSTREERYGNNHLL